MFPTIFQVDVGIIVNSTNFPSNFFDNFVETHEKNAQQGWMLTKDLELHKYQHNQFWWLHCHSLPPHPLIIPLFEAIIFALKVEIDVGVMDFNDGNIIGWLL